MEKQRSIVRKATDVLNTSSRSLLDIKVHSHGEMESISVFYGLGFSEKTQCYCIILFQWLIASFVRLYLNQEHSEMLIIINKK